MTVYELLTPGQAAARLGVSPKTLGRWAKAGTLTMARTPGGHRRYPSDAVEALRQEMHG